MMKKLIVLLYFSLWALCVWCQSDTLSNNLVMPYVTQIDPIHKDSMIKKFLKMPQYHYRINKTKDTISFSMIIPLTNEMRDSLYYIKKNKFWLTYINNESYEIGKFKPIRIGNFFFIKRNFIKHSLLLYKKKGLWKTFNSDGILVKLEKK